MTGALGLCKQQKGRSFCKPAQADPKPLFVCYQECNTSIYNQHFRHVMIKSAFCISVKKGADQLRGIYHALLFSAFLFCYSYYCLLPKSKFQASRHHLWLFSLVCVGPGWKPGIQVFSRLCSYNQILFFLTGASPFAAGLSALPFGHLAHLPGAFSMLGHPGFPVTSLFGQLGDGLQHPLVSPSSLSNSLSSSAGRFSESSRRNKVCI